MSDSETDFPSAAAISDGIRDIVISIHKAGKNDDLTVNNVRAETEKKLGLPADSLKKRDWKDESKKLIKEAVDRYCRDEPASTPSPKKIIKSKPKTKPEPKKKAKSATDSTSRGVKRKTAPPAKKPTKRRKTGSSDEESVAALSDTPVEDDEPSDVENTPPKQPAGRRKKVIVEDSDGEESTPKKATPKKTSNDAKDDEEMQDAPSVRDNDRPTTPSAAGKDDAESEMSDVLDETPVKNRRKSKSEKPAKPAKSTKAKPKATKAKVEDDPDQAEIKRLQGWLVKCGIRKVWGKELKNCETPKDKIRHLKGMLKDAGMDGKYSVEKAAKIKEQREFAKDLEDIQAGAAAWGETSATGRPRRAAAARPVQPVVFSDDSDEEDSEEKPGEKEDEGTDEDADDDVQGESGSDDGESGNDNDDDEDSE